MGRCTRKMDHFCPWVGGVVGERSFKFFIQFLFYAMIFTAYLTGVFGYYVSEDRHNVHWLVTLGLAGFFLFFTFGIVANSVHMTLQNITTVESVRGKMHLAVILPPELQIGPSVPAPPPARLSQNPGGRASDESSEQPLTSELDDPAHLNYFKRQPRPAKHETTTTYSPPPPKIYKGTVTYPLHLPSDRPPIPAPVPRRFAILETPRGLNPWNLGSPYRNFKAVFGENFIDWLLPLKHSPCCDHSSQISEFPLGPEFEVLLVDAGLVQSGPSPPPQQERRPSTTNGTKKRKQRRSAGWQNGERPPEWVSEKEARRIRHEWRRRREANKRYYEDIV